MVFLLHFSAKTTLGGLLWLLANVCGKTCTIYNSALFYASTRQLEIPPSVIPSGPPDIPTVTGNQLNKQVDLLSYHHCLYLYLSDTKSWKPTVTGNQLNKQVDLLSYHHCLYLYLSDTSPLPQPPPPPPELTLCCKQGGGTLYLMPLKPHSKHFSRVLHFSS